MTEPAFTVIRGGLLTSMEKLRGLNGEAGDVIYLAGYYAADDGGGGQFRWESGVTTGDDGGVTIVPSEPRGRWRRIYKGGVDVRWYGAYGDGKVENGALASGHDDSAAVAAAIAEAKVGNRIVDFPTGSYVIGAIAIGSGVLPENGLRFRGLERSGAYSPQSRYDDGPSAGGAVLVFLGESGDGAMVDIRNSDSGTFEDLGFDASALADHCVRFRHYEGDARSPYGWRFVGCSFTSARQYSVGVIGTGSIGVGAGPGYGDMNGLSFDACTFVGSYYSAPTLAHYRCSTSYTLSVNFNACQFYANAKPDYAVSMSSGTATFTGGVAATFALGTFYLEAEPGLDVPAITVNGMESQTSHKFLVTNMAAAVGEDDPVRSTVLNGLLCNDINAPIETEMIYWDIPGPATLVLNGCSISGDVNVASPDAKVFVQGTNMRGAATFTGNPECVTGSWLENDVQKARQPGLPSYVDQAAAELAGLGAGDLYHTAGAVRVVV